MGVVFVMVVVVLTAVQAAQHDWFIYKGTYTISVLLHHLWDDKHLIRKFHSLSQLLPICIMPHITK